MTFEDEEREHCNALVDAWVEKGGDADDVVSLLLRERAAARAKRCDKCLTNISETETEMNTLRAENERLRTSLTSRNNLCRSLRDERDWLQTKHTALVSAARAAHETLSSKENWRDTVFANSVCNALRDALKGEP